MTITTEPQIDGLITRTISVDGRDISALDATAEEFDIYVYAMLDRLYNDKRAMVKIRDSVFNRDWRDIHQRINALHKLLQINSKRREPIALFADEK